VNGISCERKESYVHVQLFYLVRHDSPYGSDITPTRVIRWSRYTLRAQPLSEPVQRMLAVYSEFQPNPLMSAAALPGAAASGWHARSLGPEQGNGRGISPVRIRTEEDYQMKLSATLIGRSLDLGGFRRQCSEIVFMQNGSAGCWRRQAGVYGVRVLESWSSRIQVGGSDDELSI
jgi:hypothetical protein